MPSLSEKDAYTRGALDVLDLIGFQCWELSPEVKSALDEIYASLVEIRLEEVVKQRVGFLGAEERKEMTVKQ